MRVVVFDLETRLSPDDLGPGDQGWMRLRAGDGGASAIVIYDFAAKWPYVYDEKTISAAAEHLEKADVVVGFCSSKLDIPVIEALVGRKLRLKEHIDIYTMIAKANAKRGLVGTKGDFTLDAVSKRTLGRGKSGKGSHAPELAAQGRWAELFGYCMADVKLTKEVFEHIVYHGGLPNATGSFLKLDIPEWIKRGLHCTEPTS